VDLVGKPHTYRQEVEVACHNDHRDHGEVAVEAHSHEEDSQEDHHQVDSNQGGRKDEAAGAAEAEDPSFCSHRSHDA